MKPIIDPRNGDFEDDASSTKRRSLISLAGSLLVEISLPKLALAWLLMLVLPSLLARRYADRRFRLGQHGQREGLLFTHRLLARAATGGRRRVRMVWRSSAVPTRRK